FRRKSKSGSSLPHGPATQLGIAKRLAQKSFSAGEIDVPYAARRAYELRRQQAEAMRMSRKSSLLIAEARYKRLIQIGVVCLPLCAAVPLGFAQQASTPPAPATSSAPGAQPTPAAPGTETASPAPAATPQISPAPDSLSSELLPRDLSAWGMFLSADNLV